MRIIASVLVGGFAYGVSLIAMSEMLRVPGESLWYWIPFAVSLGAAIAVAVPWRAWRTVNRKTTVATTVLLVLLVLAIDIAGAVWYSCSKGVCI